MRNKEDIWESEKVSCLKGCGKKSAEVLEKHWLGLIVEFKNSTDEKLKEITAVDKGLSLKKLLALKKVAGNALAGAPPVDLIIDHTKAANPYQSLYGEGWRRKICETQFMMQYCCITKLVKHIHDETAALFKGTEHKNNWCCYYDALTLMTASTTIKWMEENDYLKRWLLPLGINASTVYFGQPVGNPPKLTPMDATLNKDVDDGVIFHIALTYNLKHDDPKNSRLQLRKEDPVLTSGSGNRYHFCFGL